MKVDDLAWNPYYEEPPETTRETGCLYVVGAATAGLLGVISWSVLIVVYPWVATVLFAVACLGAWHVERTHRLFAPADERELRRILDSGSHIE